MLRGFSEAKMRRKKSDKREDCRGKCKKWGKIDVHLCGCEVIIMIAGCDYRLFCDRF